ncbi:hypothetical protein F4780DRAFT_792719 [Xylariomycetidae sp. FL0641]|nr:hypothetical protein F4780DRAFT_792719 [Xylariomycetidae sp. FL0641]
MDGQQQQQQQHGPPDLVNHQGPSMVASVWVLTAFSLVFLGLRLYCKFVGHRGLWWDDHILIVSWVLLLVSSALVTRNAALGFGMYTPAIFAKYGREAAPGHLVAMGLNGTVVGVLLVLGAVWSKTSFAVTLLRLAGGWTTVAVWVVIATMNAFMVFSAVVNFVQCDPVAKVWNHFLPGRCWDPEVNVGIGIAAASYSALMDCALALLPWGMILQLQMKKREKLGVALAMSMGIFSAATAVVKCVQLKALASADFFHDGVNLVIWSSAEVATAIMAASIPLLRVLVREVQSSRRYYHQTTSAMGDETRRSRARGKSGGGTRTTMTTTTHNTTNNHNNNNNNNNNKQDNDDDDDRSSDRSIIFQGAGLSRITKATEVQIQFHARSDHDDADAFEMHGMPGPPSRVMSPV